MLAELDEIDDLLEHGVFLDSIDVEGQSPDGDSNHGLTVVEELDGLRVQGKVVGVLK